MRCAVFGCNFDNQVKDFKKGDIKFFRFPTEPAICKAWQNACCRNDSFNSATSRVCSKHFRDDDYSRDLKNELLGYTSKNRRLLKPEAIPSVQLPRKASFSSTSESFSSARRQRISKKDNNSNLVDQLLKESRNQTEFGDGRSGSSQDDIIVTVDNELVLDTNSNVLTRDAGTNTDADNRDEMIADLQKKIAKMESEAEAMKTLFTSSQIRKLANPKSRPRWSVEDISKAIVIHSAGPRAYKLLLKKGYPFPAVSTLRGAGYLK